ncbi:MAG: hypothetical protein ABII88_08895 [Candidatus Omnitrophota bacterium]
MELQQDKIKKIIFLCLLGIICSTASYAAEYKHIQNYDENEYDKKGWVTFNHPSNIFTIKVPIEWGNANPLQHDVNVFSFSPSQSCEFTVSISQHLFLPKELPLDTVQMMFPSEVPITMPKRRSGEGWNFIRQDYQGEKNGEKWIWLAVFYGVDSNAIAMTLSDSSENIDAYKNIFEKIINSIAFNENNGTVLDN